MVALAGLGDIYRQERLREIHSEKLARKPIRRPRKISQIRKKAK